MSDKTYEGIILQHVDTKSMSPEDKATWEKIDKELANKFEQVSESNKKFFEGEVTPDQMIEKLEATEKSLAEIKDQKLSFVNKKEFDAIVGEIKDSLVRFKAATKTSASGKLEVKSIQEQIEEQLKEYIVTDEKGKKMLNKELMKGENGKSENKLYNLDLILTKAFLTAGTNYLGGVEVDPTIGTDPTQETFLRGISNVASTNATAIVVADLETTGDAEWVPEGGLKPLLEGTLSEKVIKVGKVALSAKVSEEVLMDISQLAAEIRLEIFNKVSIEEENGILNGSGTGGEIQGISADIPEFALTGIQVENPNNFDVIVALYTQIISNSFNKFRPSAVVVNPIDYANMQLSKDVNGQYLRPYRSGDELIKGLQIHSSTAVAVGSILMGDFRFLNIRDRMGYSVKVGWANDDFQKNLVTIIGEKRLTAYIKSNHLLAFVKGEFDAIKAAIEPAA